MTKWVALFLAAVAALTFSGFGLTATGAVLTAHVAFWICSAALLVSMLRRPGEQTALRLARSNRRG